MSSSESRRRAEIEAKRAKLAELKKAREERSSRIAAAGREGRASESSTSSSRKDLDDFVSNLLSSGAGSSGVSPASSQAAGPTSGRRSVVGGAMSPRKSGLGHESSEYGSESGTGTATMVNRGEGEGEGEIGSSRQPPTLVDVSTELFEFPTRERVYYTKEVQTTGAGSDETSSLATEAGLGMNVGTDVFPSGSSNGAGIGTRADGSHDVNSTASGSGDLAWLENALRHHHISLTPQALEGVKNRVVKELEIRREEDEVRRSEEEEKRLEREIEEGLRELTPAELNLIFGATDFTDFVEQSSKVVERALTDTYDYMKDYTMVDDGGAEQGDKRQLKCVRTFWDDKLCRNRSITDVDWSTRHPELSVASYSRNDLSDSPDGLVLVWNMHLSDRPEFVFHAQTDVLSVAFSPFQPNLVIGGTYSGQILIWDTRARVLPVLKSPLSSAGHTHPVYSLSMVGTQNAHNLLSASTDGVVCSWQLDMLAKPHETLDLNANFTPAQTSSHGITSIANYAEVSVTSMGFADQDTTRFCVGTEEGAIYEAGRYNRAGAKAGISGSDVYRGHAGPVTGLHFHPLAGPIDFSDLFLTSSVDWTSRLWRARSANAPRTGQTQNVPPILTFEESSDYVYDVKWHPKHPALFAQVDGAGKFDIYNLNSNTERPILSTQVGSGRALNKLAWDKKDGRHAALGSADGRLYVYDVGSVATPADDEFTSFQRTVAQLLSSISSTATSSSLPSVNVTGAPGTPTTRGLGIDVR